MPIFQREPANWFLIHPPILRTQPVSVAFSSPANILDLSKMLHQKFKFSEFFWIAAACCLEAPASRRRSLSAKEPRGRRRSQDKAAASCRNPTNLSQDSMKVDSARFFVGPNRHAGSKRSDFPGGAEPVKLLRRSTQSRRSAGERLRS
jgi:hypothetical protein